MSETICISGSGEIVPESLAGTTLDTMLERYFEREFELPRVRAQFIADAMRVLDSLAFDRLGVLEAVDPEATDNLRRLCLWWATNEQVQRYGVALSAVASLLGDAIAVADLEGVADMVLATLEVTQ